MMELLEELLLTAALSFLLSLFLAKFVSSSLTIDRHLRHGVRPAFSPPPSAAATDATSAETSVSLEEKDGGAIRLDLVASAGVCLTPGSRTVADGLVQKKHVARGYHGIGEVTPVEGNLPRPIDTGGHYRGEKTTKDVILDAGNGVTQVEDEATDQITALAESGSGASTSDDGFTNELMNAIEFKATANQCNCKDAKGDLDLVEDEIVVEGGNQGMEDEGKGRALPLLNGCDDWEGIERSDTEKLFAVASEFGNTAAGKEALSQLSDDLQMRLYGLHKIATEGPCYQTHPLILKLSARARWHSWRKLGNMEPDVAMEQYIDLLSYSFPEFLKNRFGDETTMEGSYSSGGNKSGLGNPTTSLGQDQNLLENKRKVNID